MHFIIRSSPNSKHRLDIYLSDANESKLEGFHGSLPHFANGGMRSVLADILHAKGTARHNASKRHERQVAQDPTMRGGRKPMHWTTELAFPNHSLLHHCNEAMKCAGIEKLPFSNVRILPPFDPGDDDPEFFMDYWHKEIDRQREFPRSTCSDRCNCPMCGTNSEALPTAPDVAGDYVGLPLITERPSAAETNNTVERANDTVQRMESNDTVDTVDVVDTVNNVDCVD